MTEAEDDKKYDAGVENVDIDIHFPTMILALMTTEIASLFRNGCKVVVGVEDARALYACGDKHVHIDIVPDATLAEINGLLVISFAIALLCDRRNDWRPPPKKEEIVAILKEMEMTPGLGEIKHLITEARRTLPDVFSGFLSVPSDQVH